MRSPEAQPKREGMHRCHRDALAVLDSMERIEPADACEYLTVIVSTTVDPMLRLKCLDVLHYLRPAQTDGIPRGATMALARLREYCELVLTRSG
ncbi:MAG: hypothetical protein ACTHK2_07865 [Dokdonella sp.]|uniref:hypothetical protein n=1 Tax=Dokdonella sp. TaxID=2291710 RepID=UPI003F7FCE92